MKCPNCGASATGKFCSTCGARLGAATCAACGAALVAGVKFCHACGAPAGGGVGAAGPAGARPSQVPWVIAGSAVVALLVILAAVLLRPGSGAPASAPAAPAGGAGPVNLAELTPREAADRLFNRVMTADEGGDTAEAARFAPMAIQAYGMLDGMDADARYHVGLLSLVTRDYAGAVAQADSLAQAVPGHLYAAILRAQAARAQGDQATARRAEQAFLDSYDREVAANRAEYGEHPGLLERFRKEVHDARASR
jgi:hypothetical protein